MTKRLISTSFFDMFAEYLAANKLDATDLEKQIDAIKKQFPHRAPDHYFTDIYEQIKKRHPKPALGFRIGIGAEARHYGVVGYMATTCDTLQQALLRCMPYQGLFETNMDAHLVDLGDSMQLKWWGDNPEISQVECEIGLAAFVNFYQLLIGKYIPPVSVELPFDAEPDIQHYEAIIGCPVHFNARCVSITLPKMVMLQDIQTSDPYLRSLYERQARALLDEEQPDNDFLQQTRLAIQGQLIDGSSSAETIAESMGLSLRTFYRKLSDYEVRYRTLLADTRLSLAQIYLTDQSLSLADISLMLGYSDQSAFTRAFVGWMGVSPSKYRDAKGGRH